MNDLLKVIAVVGPTASGKTRTAIELSHAFNGEVVSADSRYFYRQMDIGTAKPTKAEMGGIPHHLIDVTDLDHLWSFALFKSHAIQCIQEISQRGKVPILAGGTGQYIRGLLEGWDIPPQPPNPALRDQITAWGEQIGSEVLHQKLAVLDPQAASRIDHRNFRRTVRALEVILHTGRRFSEQRSKSTSPFSWVMIGIAYPRQELYQRIDQRIDWMIASGFIEEVKQLLDCGYENALRTIAAIGYTELIDFLQEKMLLDEAVILIKRRTRLFVRRQANWFKTTDRNIAWFTPGSSMLDQMMTYLVEHGFCRQNQ